MRGLCQTLAILYLGAIPVALFAQDPTGADGYTFHLAVRDGTSHQMSNAPSITVREGHSGSVEGKVGGSTFRFDVEVDEQDGKPLGLTKISFTKDGKLTSGPRVTQFIGQKATIGFDGVEVGIDVQLAKGGR